MTDENLKQTMKKEWQNVRKRFYYPQLPQPQLVEKIKGGGSFNFENLEITVEEPYVKSFRGKGIAATDEESDTIVLNECLTHELTHYMKHPGSVFNILRLQKAGQGIADAETISRLRRDYTEAQTNLDLIVAQNHPGTISIVRELNQRGAYPGSLGKLHYELYQEVSGQDFGVKLTRQERKLISKLKWINFLDKNQETDNFRKFAEILKDYQPPQKKKQKKRKNKQREGQGSSCSGKGNGLESFTDNQIREGLKQFAQECSTPDEYEEIVRQVLGENKEKAEQDQINGGKVWAMGKRAGSGRGITQLAENFYTALAEKYTIPVRKKPMHRNGSLYPHSHTSFEVGDPITEVDAFSTPGILPGITKKWLRKEGEVFDNEESVPDSFLVIDNSGSMPNPIEGISLPVLGATAISNAYLHNGLRVAVYNFGGNNYLLQPTKDKEAVHKQLRMYTGGGTTFNPRFLERVLRQNEGEFDISIISDMDISNLNSFIETVLKIPHTHRIHLLYTENSNYVGQLRKSFGNKENVAILPLTSEYNIQQITMGELKKSVK